MPNHITNILTINGSSKDTLTLLALVIVDGDMNFETFAPIPTELKGTMSPARVLTQAEYDEAIKEPNPHGLGSPITQEMSDKFIKEYGFNNWYDWQTANWGTKWDAYDTIVDGNIIRFDTAWSTPYTALVKLSERFPELLLDVEFADEDTGSNVGEYSLQNGEIVDENIPEYGTESIRMALRIKGESDYHLEDYWTDCVDEDIVSMSEGDDSYIEKMLPLIVEAEVVNDDFPMLLITKLRDYALTTEQFFYVAKLEETITRKKAVLN